MKAGFLTNLLEHIDLFSKVILALLLVMSVVCWTLFLCTCISMYRKRRSLAALEKQVLLIGGLEDLKNLVSRVRSTYGGELLAKVFEEYTASLNYNVSRAERLSNVMRYWEQQSDIMLGREELYFPLLSTSATVSPLLGLLGTVWGLIQAFFSIGKMQSADMAVVAPGIAQALITTLAGLIVAIPALAMYNGLIAQLRGLEDSWIQLSDRLFFVLERKVDQQ